MGNNQALLDEIRETLIKKKELVNEIRTYRLTKTDVVKLDTSRYNDEFIDGLLIKDISSVEQIALGITILHVLAKKEIEFELHMHENQSQTVSVINGKLLDLDSSVLFEKGQSFFVPKAHLHRLKYFSDSELLVVYMPALSQI